MSKINSGRLFHAVGPATEKAFKHIRVLVLTVATKASSVARLLKLSNVDLG